MIVGIGTDIVEIVRIQKALKRKSFMQRVFTSTEISYCLSVPAQQASSFAARFATKEAVLKALGTGLRGGKLTDIEVYRDSLGKPEVNLYNNIRELAVRNGVKKIHLSISHTSQNAIAQVVLEG